MDERGDLLFIRRPRQHNTEGPPYPLVRGGASFAQDPCSENPRGFHKGGVVEQRQRRQRRIADRPLSRAFLARRGVEGLQQRMQVLPLPVSIKSAAVLVLVGVGLVVAKRKVEMLVITGRLVGPGAGPPQPLYEQTACRQGIVANEFGWKPV